MSLLIVSARRRRWLTRVTQAFYYVGSHKTFSGVVGAQATEFPGKYRLHVLGDDLHYISPDGVI